MNLILKRLLGITAAVATGAAALLGTGADTAVGDDDSAHCARAEQDMWSDGPSRSVTGHDCNIPTDRDRWFTVEIDALVQVHYKGDNLDGGVDRTETLHNRTIRCLGYTSDDDTVNWFGCPPA